MAVDEALFRQTLGHFATGVTVVTTESGGERFGMTVSAFASLSLRPQLVVVLIEKGVRTHDAIAEAGTFAVNVLSAAQEAVSRRFASRMPDRFEGVTVARGELGMPVLEESLAVIECRLTESFPGGDHTIFVGEVMSVRTHEGEPLIYYRSGYRGIE